MNDILPETGGPTAVPAASCCALVVTYHPPAAVLETVSAMVRQCEHVLVIDNGSDAAELVGLDGLAAESPAVELVKNATNIGLASALNQGVQLARMRGHVWILFLDQDTVPLPNMVADLRAALAAHPRPERVGVIGSNHYDELGRLAHQRLPGRLYEIVPFVITSGSMSPLHAFHKTGPFRDDFFIDYVDIEFGYRLESLGMESLLCLEPTMRHIWGTPDRVRILGKELMITNHSPLRRYFIVRNGIYVTTRYWRRFPVRCVAYFFFVFANAAIVVIMEEQKWQKAKAMFVGFWHGLFGRLGPIPAYLLKS